MHTRHARYVYNLGLEQRQMWHPFKREQFKKLSATSQMLELTEARKEFPWLAEGARDVQEGALWDLERAYKNWWSNPAFFGRPTFRSKHESQSFIIRCPTVHLLSEKWATVKIRKLGEVKFRLTRALADVMVAKSARVILSPSGQWHISFTTLPTPFTRTSTGSELGIDRGVTRTISTSNGTHSTIPALTKGEQRRFLALEHRLGRQIKGSNRWEATRRDLNQLRDRQKNRHRDWIEKTSTRVVRDNDLIALEDLQTSKMVKAPAPQPDPENPGVFLHNGAKAKARLNRAILGSSWGELERRIEDKAGMAPEDSPVHVVLVHPKNTSITCHKCGYISAENRKSQAVFHCTRCGHTAHADINAARNILTAARNTLPPDGRSTDASVTQGAASNRARRPSRLQGTSSQPKGIPNSSSHPLLSARQRGT